MSPGSPHLLFIPGGGRTGLGESVRTLALAHGARERWPEARIGFITDDQHVRLDGDTFERHTVTGTVSRSVEAVNRLLRELKPDLVVFDGRGRGAQISCAFRAGARTVYIAAAEATRRRAFRWSRLRRLDQLWIRRDFVDPWSDLTLGERARLRVARGPEVHHVQAIHAPPDAGRLAALRDRIGLGGDSYLLFAAGGGGWEHEGRPASDLFAAAAREVKDASGRSCVVVLGPLYTGRLSAVEGVTVVSSLSPPEMIDLVGGAEIVVSGGGGLMGQALGSGRICVAAAVGGSDQPGRIQRGAEAGLVVASPLAADAIAERVLDLLRDAPRREELAKRIDHYGLGNGLPEALDLLQGLLAAGPSAR